ncbi:phosphoenolpyruvate--protein phosphotransferase [Lactobacillus sp. W8089]|nr:phosphoenolpyruvate--protein phosphotransferase [Lactobacillus sp. W8086]MBI0108989.1 phosphoenolpyruvate--protein phosphotransferase [Lactobacillus sp. W8085]MBI0112205.1 phosphoenolpyruvate--protein phosphotransferase [Lactobacillus sp. W8088]MBI0115921.1 phosphoenolpyruvate--protein phosphotransferase [Lactobacillus sp. W8087]MBI0119646.1 phosphoenolpyruvate--protein phosphotransferase [Lactobacillus sp. W8089]MBI0131611.1 phosphoenolpyruvate--protein phosphotransferase [Lactobacillus sp
MTKTLKGIAASDGFATAPAYLLVEPDLSFKKTTIKDVQAEVQRLRAAVQESDAELTKIRDTAQKTLGEEEAQVFDAHKMILADPEFVGAIESQIADQKLNAEQVLRTVADNFITTFEAMTDNKYMQERAADVRDVTKRIMSHLLGVQLPNPALIDHEVIVIAHDLAPSDTAQLNKKYVKAFVTDVGGRTAHSAIMARSLEIPAVVGTNTITKDVVNGDELIVDGVNGDVVIHPSAADSDHYQKAAAEYASEKAEWSKLKNSATVTADGKHFDIAANIGTPKDLAGANANGAEAIGLYRTEFLYMDSAELPSEEDQFQAYKTVLEGMNNKPVVVRTMDIGGDKHLPYLPLPEEMNPFLGYRAIRISLDRQDIFRTQLRALLRASAFGKLCIMFPMIATLQEFRQAKAILQEEMQKLKADGIAYDEKDLQVGIMVEIPAAAVLADQFAKEVDFFSIGTNDLIQYTMAADRGNDQVSYLYQPYNPSILRLIKRTIDAAHQEGKWVGMCGEAAGDSIMTPLLMGMGLDEYSMSATSILRVRSLMKHLDTNELQELVEQAINVSLTNEENKQLVTKFVEEHRH